MVGSGHILGQRTGPDSCQKTSLKTKLHPAQGESRIFGLVFKVFAGLLLSAASLLALSAQASETITFPEEDLASESVLPVFDHPVSVKNRSLITAKRFEIGVQGGLSLLEPFYNPVAFGLSLAYHISNEHAINISGVSFLQGLSSNANNLNPVPNSSPLHYMNLQYAPAPKYLVSFDYQYTGFYGKISVTKDFVMNLNIYGLIGLDAFGIGDTVAPGLDLGIGQKLYFTPNFGLRLDFRFVAYQGPDVLSHDLSTSTSVQSASAFTTSTQFVSLLSVGLVYLFPGM